MEFGGIWSFGVRVGGHYRNCKYSAKMLLRTGMDTGLASMLGDSITTQLYFTGFWQRGHCVRCSDCTLSGTD